MFSFIMVKAKISVNLLLFACIMKWSECVKYMFRFDKYKNVRLALPFLVDFTRN